MSLAEINGTGRLIWPDSWIDVTDEYVPEPVAPAAPRLGRRCCGRPYDEHPRTDSTTLGTCHGPHRGTEVAMHWDGRRYRCGLCALADFHAT